MEHSILQGLTSPLLEVYLKNMVYEKLYYLDFFPIRNVNSLTYKTIIGNLNNNAMADVVSYNSSAPEKTRKKVTSLVGDIPPIRMKKIMEETDFNEYNSLNTMNTPDKDRIKELIYNDVDACIKGVNDRLEWIALQAMAGGTVTLNSTSNEAGVITEDSINFGLPAANKEVEAAANNYWTTGAYATNTPITDIQTIIAEAKAAGSMINYMIMNLSKFIAFQTSTQVQNYAGVGYVAGAIFRPIPTLEQVNTMLASRGLPTIIVVNTVTSIENKSHTITTADPWLNSSSEDRYVLFAPDIKLGNTLVGPIAMETNAPKQCTVAKKGHVLVSKWSKADPLSEITMGETNAFPVWPTIDSCWILDTESHTTYGA